MIEVRIVIGGEQPTALKSLSRLIDMVSDMEDVSISFMTAADDPPKARSIKRMPTKKFEGQVSQLLLATMIDRNAPLNTADAKAITEKGGYQPDSYSSQMSELLQKGFVNRDGKGRGHYTYTITQKGREYYERRMGAQQ